MSIAARMKRRPRRDVKRFIPLGVTGAGVVIVLAAAPDGLFNGADFIGWTALLLGAMRVARPVLARGRRG